MEKNMNLLERFQRYMRNSGNRERSINNFTRTLYSIRKWLFEEYDVDIFSEQSVIKCSSAMMDDWYNTCIVQHNPPYAAETKKSYTLAIQRFFNFLILYHIIDKQNDPTSIIPKQKHAPIEADISPDKIYSSAEIQRMLTFDVPEHKRGNNDKFKAIVATLLETGLRAFELCSITVGQIRHCKNSIIYVERKGGKVKPVVIGSAAWPFIIKYYKDQRSNALDNEPFFVAESGRGYTGMTLNQFVTHRQTILGIAHPGLHNFRHTAISNVAQSGNIVAARDFAGHSSVTMTNRYMHTKEEARQNVVNDTEMSRIMNEISGNHPTVKSTTSHPQAKEKEELDQDELLRRVFGVTVNPDDDDDDDEFDEDVPEFTDDDFEI